MHYNQVFTDFWYQNRFDVVYQPSCLQQPYDQKCWPIRFPEVNWTDRTIVIMHCQDFVSIDDQGCPELKVIQDHFGSRSRQVIVIHWNYDLGKVYQGPLNLVYFPTHTYEIICNLFPSQDKWQPALQVPRAHHWQCLNGIPRRHRRWVADFMKGMPHGILSLGNEIPLPEWPYSTYFGCENESNWFRLQSVYGDCDINIVTETMYTHRPGIISEKTVFAFLALQIPIVIGYPGIVQDCQTLGFDMFSDIVDISYDWNTNNQRWVDALEYNRHLLTVGVDRDQVRERLKHNQQHLFRWPERMIDDYHIRCREIADCLTKP